MIPLIELLRKRLLLFNVIALFGIGLIYLMDMSFGCVLKVSQCSYNPITMFKSCLFIMVLLLITSQYFIFRERGLLK